MVNADKQTKIDSQGISNEHFLLLGMQELMVNADKHGHWRHLCGALLNSIRFFREIVHYWNRVPFLEWFTGQFKLTITGQFERAIIYYCTKSIYCTYIVHIFQHPSRLQNYVLKKRCLRTSAVKVGQVGQTRPILVWLIHLC